LEHNLRLINLSYAYFKRQVKVNLSVIRDEVNSSVFNSDVQLKLGV